MSPAPPSRPKRNRVWRGLRLCFRGFRIVVWLFLLMLLAFLTYLNQSGLPGFIKRPLLQTLREHGLDLQFTRLRLRWYEGIVAENARFGRPDDPLTPELRLGEVRVQINARALTRLHLQVDKLVLRQGRFVWPIGQTNGQALRVENIQSELRFLPGDQWALDNFSATFAGAKIRLSGTVTNASAVSQWQFLKGGETNKTQTAGAWHRRMQRLADSLERVSFVSIPELRLEVSGDARDFQSFSVAMAITAPGATTPWGSVTDAHFQSHVFPADTNGIAHARIQLEADRADTPWASAEDLRLEVDLRADENETNIVHGQLEVAAASAYTRWASASNIVAMATWIHSTTNLVPLSGDGHLSCKGATNEIVQAAALELTLTMSRPLPGELPEIDASWAWWSNIQPYSISWTLQTRDFGFKDLRAATVDTRGSWTAPMLIVSNLNATLYDGHLAASADLDIVSRKTRLGLTSDFDPQKTESVMGESARRWVEQFSYNTPPQLKGTIDLVLPSWTNRTPDWKQEVLPTLVLDGGFEAGPGSYRRIDVSWACSHLTYSNMCWHLPDLEVHRPEGIALAEHRANERTKDFYWRINGLIYPPALRPELDRAAQEALNLFTFSNTPAISAEIWGRSHEPELTGVRGTVAATNLDFRGQSFSSVQAALAFTNNQLRILTPVVERPTGYAAAEGLLADFHLGLLFLTNGYSTMEPMVIASAIGPMIARTLAPYKFEAPPSARVYGTIPLQGEEDADLHFDLRGGPFSWWKFNLPQVAAQLHWRGLHLDITNVQMNFYGGPAVGSAHFDFPRGKAGTDFSFFLGFTNTAFHELMSDLTTSTNRLEGTLSGAVAVTQANSENWNSVFGFGDVNLRDGLIWDIPAFGFLTPVLNGIAPGLGNVRAGAGTASFTITNGIIRSDDLEIRSAAFRLQYRGTVDFESRLNARVEAELLKDMWVIGPLVSTALWPVTKMFEYRVSGTLDQPKTEPLYIVPKIVLFPFHPFRTLKGFFPPEGGRTNSAPVFQDVPK